MPNYQEGKIYKITAGDKTYYGSTTLTLATRFRCFRNSKKYYSCSVLLTLPDCKISLVEMYPCETSFDLKMRERWWCDNNECINEISPIRTDAENKDYHKKYNSSYQRKTPQKRQSKEKTAEYCKKWYKTTRVFRKWLKDFDL